MFCVSPQSRPAMAELEFYIPLGRSVWYTKSCFPSFLTVTQRGVYFSSLLRWFWFVQLEVVERNRCVCICRKTESSNHSSIAFDSSECIWLHPDKAWVYIESDSVELFVHTWCFGMGLLGWALAWWRISSSAPPPPSSSPPLPPWQSDSGALGLELSVKGEGCVGPEAMNVALRKGQRERMSLGWKSPWNAGTDEPTYPPFHI